MSQLVHGTALSETWTISSPPNSLKVEFGPFEMSSCEGDKPMGRIPTARLQAWKYSPSFISVTPFGGIITLICQMIILFLNNVLART